MSPRLPQSGIPLLALALLSGDVSTAHAQTQRASRYPLVDAMTGYLLGGSTQNRQWVQPEKAKDQVQSGIPYRLYNPVKKLGTAIGSKPVSADAPCPDTFIVDLKMAGGKKTSGLSVPLPMPSSKVPADAPVYGLAAPWNALPRVPVALNPKGSVYAKAVTEFLATKGVKTPAEIKQIWRVDIEGDGTDEVLISATRHRSTNGGDYVGSNSSAGDYSVVLLRKVWRGKVITIPLEQEFHLKNTTFSAPNVFGLSAVLDINGDGKLEVITRGRYYEGDWVAVYEITPSLWTKPGTIKPVLTTGCGA